MSRRFPIPIPVVILLLGGMVVAAVATLKPSPSPEPPSAIEPPKVAVVLANPSVQALTVTSQGTVAPRREISLVAEISGRITDVAPTFVEGAFVRADQTLVTIDPRDYQLALLRAEAQVADARQLLATEQGRARQAQREWRDLGNPQANDLFLRKPQLAAAEAMLQSAQADRDQAQLNLQRTQVAVPFDGRIRQTQVDLGQYVTPGTPIAEVYDTSVAQVRLPLTDRQVALVNLPLGLGSQTADGATQTYEGPAVTLSGTIAGRRYHWQGQITRTEASLDTRTRFYYAIAEVKDPYLAAQTEHEAPLIVGLFVEAQIRGRELDNVVTVPRQALFKRNHIYTVDGDNKVREKTVTLLHTNGNQAWIRGDLSAGEAIVVGQQSYLSEGLVVTPETEREMVADS